MTVTSRLHIQKDKDRQKRIESDVPWGLEDPESGLKIPRGDIDGVGEVK